MKTPVTISDTLFYNRVHQLDLARNNNFKVVLSVTKNFYFPCGGDNAGPKKIEKAELQGVEYLSEYQFMQLLKTGEAPHAA